MRRVIAGYLIGTTDREVPMILRRIARPMLAAVFVSGGLDTLRNPKPRIQAAEPVLDRTVHRVQDRLPDQVPTDAETLVKINAAVQVGAGLALALGRFPRLSALLLAGSLVPTTAAGHRFWEFEDPGERHRQQVHFFKNLGLAGGLLIAAADTHGRSTRRAKNAAKHAEHTVRHAADTAKHSVRDMTGAAKHAVRDAAGNAKHAVWDATAAAKHAAKVAAAD